MSDDTVEKDMVVSVHYTGTLQDESVFDTSDGSDPLTFLVGHRQMIPGFEEELMGAKQGDSRTFTLEPERAYGDRDEKGVMELPREQFPEDSDEFKLEVGATLVADMEGQPAPFRILTIAAKTVTVDFNHLLAGKTLTFAAEVVELRKATEEELAHGHVHGPGGHHH